MGDLIDTTEMYLKTIYELEEEGVPALRARIVERLSHSGPTVSETVARLERDGFLTVADSRKLELTVTGRRKATEVMRKHRLAERLLVDVIGLPWEEAHNEACRWEHVMSTAVEERLQTMLHDATVDPYGNPIPLDMIEGPGPHGAPFAGLISIGSVVDDVATSDQSRQVTIARIAEPLQVDTAALSDLRNAGIVPGVRVEVSGLGACAVVSDDGATGSWLELSTAALHHLFVRP